MTSDELRQNADIDESYDGAEDPGVVLQRRAADELDLLTRRVAELERVQSAHAALSEPDPTAEAVNVIRQCEEALSNSYDVIEYPASPHCQAWVARDRAREFLKRMEKRT